MDIKQVIDYLSSYRGKKLKIMEVCGTHTSSIFKNGIRDLISSDIKLISGPGCPVCVTPRVLYRQVRGIRPQRGAHAPYLWRYDEGAGKRRQPFRSEGQGRRFHRNNVFSI